jgi:hypothetical protein
VTKPSFNAAAFKVRSLSMAEAEAVRLFPHLRHGYSPSFCDWVFTGSE